jgi:hypothetical protein
MTQICCFEASFILSSCYSAWSAIGRLARVVGVWLVYDYMVVWGSLKEPLC